ncbi:MAG: HAMP domain-containing protein [Clostridiales Family XIII bacterium]|jgi:signal transduction histidine kinase|nr:HAMP domain-containing protein [Clostridiales Family XIII bacterium]
MRSLRTQIAVATCIVVFATIVAACILSNYLTSGMFAACMAAHYPAVAAFSVIFSVAMSFILARQISHPIVKAAAVTEQIAAGDYDVRFESPTKTTELHDLVEAVNHLAGALSKQETLRRQLTADVAHELRTPLTTLGTHLEAMTEGVWEPTPDRLNSCHEEILRLGKMVSDIERLERAEADDLQLDKTETDLFALAQSVTDNFAGELSKKNLRLDLCGEASIVSVDKDRIAGVIGNLISNAVKYTPDGGGIRITVEDKDKAGILTIEDTGIGISETDLPYIFERFYRADKSRTRGTGGAGIGLAIAKSVVTAHGGEVTAQSEPGQGSRFTISLPK